MYIGKGFMGMPSLADNRPATVAPFGEFPTKSQTFGRDIRNYARTEYPDVELYLLQCISEVGSRVEPSKAFTNKVLALGEWIYQQHIAKLIPSDKSKAAFIKSINDQFPDLRGVLIGAILTGSPDMNMPDFIQFKLADGNIQYQYTVWFSNDAFVSQYDNAEVIIVPPLDVIDGLNDSKANVQARLANVQLSRTINDIQEVSGNNPPTAIIAFDLTWHDPNNPNAVLNISWPAVCYGTNGTDTDTIKQAIRDYLDAKSTARNWNTIFPDLYSENEFIIMPMWDNRAIQPDALSVGLYRSFLPYPKLISTMRTIVPASYDRTDNDKNHIDVNTIVGTAGYRTIMFGAVGNPNNKNAVYSIIDKFPDYMALTTESSDYNRMSPKTQTFAKQLNTALDLAYAYTPTTLLPPGFTRLIRKTYHYISFIIDGYVYAVLTKYGYDRIST